MLIGFGDMTPFVARVIEAPELVDVGDEQGEVIAIEDVEDAEPKRAPVTGRRRCTAPGTPSAGRTCSPPTPRR